MSAIVGWRDAFVNLTLALVFAAPLAAQSDQINTNGDRSRGGNIVADARAWWGRHTDQFRTHTSNCLGLIEEAEQHRQKAMQYYDAAKKARHQEGSRLQHLGNDEYAIVTRIVRQFYECARPRPDQFNTKSGDDPPRPRSDEIQTYGNGSTGGAGRSSGGDDRPRIRPARPLPPPTVPRDRPGAPQTLRADRFESICDLQRLAQLVFERYHTGRPIARWQVRNAATPTYLVTVSGLELEEFGRGKNTVGQLFAAWANIQALNAYRVAIFRAVADLPRGATIILVGHSQGGMEAQNIVRSLVERWGFRVPMVVSFGAPITTNRQNGTAYLHVRASDEPLQALDRRYNLDSREILLSNGRTPEPHTSYPTSASGLSLFRVPSVSTLSTPCWEIELTTVRDYEAPDLFTQFFGPPSPRARNTPLNPQAGLAGDPTHVPGRDPRAEEGPNEDMNCFWVSIAKDRFWATGIPVPARCELRPIRDEDIPTVLVNQYGDAPLDDLHGPTPGAGVARHRDGRKVESDRGRIERALGRGDPMADGRRGLVFVRDPTHHGAGHVFSARNVNGRIQYWDEQQGYDSEFRFVPGMQFFFYRTN